MGWISISVNMRISKVRYWNRLYAIDNTRLTKITRGISYCNADQFHIRYCVMIIVRTISML